MIKAHHTVMVKDINPSGASFPNDLININGTFFSAPMKAQMVRNCGKPYVNKLIKMRIDGESLVEKFKIQALTPLYSTRNSILN